MVYNWLQGMFPESFFWSFNSAILFTNICYIIEIQFITDVQEICFKIYYPVSWTT